MIQVSECHTLSWDNENGCGCEVYQSAAERDEALREALLSYLDERKRRHLGLEIAPTSLTLPQLLALFEESDFTDGARFTCSKHTVANVSPLKRYRLNPQRPMEVPYRMRYRPRPKNSSNP